MAFPISKYHEHKSRLQRFADLEGNVPEPGDQPAAFKWSNDGPEEWSAFVAEAAAETAAVIDTLRPKVTGAVSGGLELCWKHLTGERDSGPRSDWWNGLSAEERRAATRGIDWVEDQIKWAARVGESEGD